MPEPFNIPHYFGISIPVSFYTTSSSTAAVVFDPNTGGPAKDYPTFYWKRKNSVVPHGEAFLNWVDQIGISARTCITPISWNWAYKSAPLYAALGVYNAGDRARRSAKDINGLSPVYRDLFNYRANISLDTLAFMFLKACSDNHVELPYKDIYYKGVRQYFGVQEVFGKFGKCLEYMQLYNKMMEVKLPLHGIK